MRKSFGLYRSKILKRYNFYLPEKMMNELAKLAKKEGISRSEMIRNILRRHLVTNGLVPLTDELKAGYNPRGKHEPK
jgi:metal-responsive CopG/Arc/MetJ family transcriptional regulator